MAEKKSQHFVPQFYLRNFSDDGKRVNLFLLKSERTVAAAPLRPQCAVDYFYGRDLAMENALGTLEGATGHVLREIIRHARLPEPGSESDLVFRTYVAIQWGRTRSHVTDSSEALSQTLKAAFAEKWKAEGGSEDDLKELEIESAEAARDSVSRTAEIVPFLGDLEVKLLLANGLGEFVTSDTPVILTNPFYLGRYAGGVTGLDAAGLVMIFPVSPTSLAIFYDRNYYRVGPQSHRIIPLGSITDLVALNNFQGVNAVEVVYFRGAAQGAAFAPHYARVKGLRLTKRNVLRTARAVGPGEKGTLLHSFRATVNYRPPLACLSLLRKWRGNVEAVEQMPARNPELRNLFQVYTEEVRMGKRKPNFLRFMAQRLAPGSAVVKAPADSKGGMIEPMAREIPRKAEEH